jgi:periplasmic protein TonB
MRGSRQNRFTGSVRWTLCAVAVIAMHAAAGAGALWKAPVLLTEVDTAGAMVVELAAEPIARADIAPALPPGPDQVQGASTPDQRSDVTQERPDRPAEATEPITPKLDPPPPSAQAAVALPVAARQPVAMQQPNSVANQGAETTRAAQVEADRQAEVARAAVAGAATKMDPRVMARWHAQLSVALERNKRYPGDAKARREQGVVEVNFVIDRKGHLVSSRVTKGSGHAALDAEALTLLKRSEPFPLPAQAFATSTIELLVPIRFSLQ